MLIFYLAIIAVIASSFLIGWQVAPRRTVKRTIPGAVQCRSCGKLTEFGDWDDLSC